MDEKQRRASRGKTVLVRVCSLPSALQSALDSTRVVKNCLEAGGEAASDSLTSHSAHGRIL